MELELKHLAPYLAYELKGKIKQNIVTMCTLHNGSLQTKPSIHRFTYCSFHHFTPILRPLSDLTKEIEVNGEKFVPIEKLQNIFNFNDDFEITDCLQILLHNCEPSYYFPPNFFLKLYEKLFEWHFDVFDLHSKSLCVYYDETTLNQK